MSNWMLSELMMRAHGLTGSPGHDEQTARRRIAGLVNWAWRWAISPGSELLEGLLGVRVAAAGNGCAEVGGSNHAGGDGTSTAGDHGPACAEDAGRGPAGDGSEKSGRGHCVLTVADGCGLSVWREVDAGGRGVAKWSLEATGS